MNIPVIIPRCQKSRSFEKGSVCFDCDLHSTCKINCMPGKGRKNSLMIIGPQPEAGDITAKEPFKSNLGRKLDFLLMKAGIHRETVYLTHAIKCDTVKNKKPTKKSQQACKSHLIEEIEWVQPKVIVTFGNEALQAIFPWATSAEEWRGFAIPLHDSAGNIKSYCIPMISAAKALKDPTSDPIFIRDLKLAKRILKEAWTPPALDIKINVVTNINQLKHLTKRLLEAPSWAFDLETQGFAFLTNKILCASFSTDGKEAFVVPIDKEFKVAGQIRSWFPEERRTVLELLKIIFLSQADKAAQNGKFDLKWLKSYKISVRNFNFDTMLAHHLVDSEKPHDLIFISQWYEVIHQKYDATLEEAKKAAGGDYSKIECDTLYYYAGIDAAVTQASRPHLEKLLDDTGTRKVFEKVAMKLNPVLADMEYRGVKINVAGMDAIITDVDSKIIVATQEIQEILGIPEFKPNAVKPVKDYFIKNRIRLTKTTESGAFSFDEEVLDSLKRNPKVGDLCGKVLDLRELSKLKTTYLDGNGKVDTKTGEYKGMRNKLDINNYVHSNYNISGTYTGRLSSNGPNLQNIPKKNGIRQLFIPDHEDDLFMDVDYKQLEVRIAAAIFKDLVLIQEILDGVDMHSRNASQFLMRVPERDFLAVMAQKTHELYHLYYEKRRAAKCVTFGVLYGSTARGVSQREDVPLEDAETFIRKFFNKYKGISSGIKLQHERVVNTHKVISPTGRVIKFHDLEWAQSEYCTEFDRKQRIAEVQRISVNMPIQGFGSDVFQMKCVELYNYMRKKKMQSSFKLSIHDGFVLNTKSNERAELKIMVPKIMRVLLNKGTRYEVPLEVDTGFTYEWEGVAVEINNVQNAVTQ